VDALRPVVLATLDQPDREIELAARDPDDSFAGTFLPAEPKSARASALRALGDQIVDDLARGDRAACGDRRARSDGRA
jgi:hypothetical protein